MLKQVIEEKMSIYDQLEKIAHDLLYAYGTNGIDGIQPAVDNVLTDPVAKKPTGSTGSQEGCDIPFHPLTDRQCISLIAKYQDDLELWDNFWNWAVDKSNHGMSYECLLASYTLLEKYWQDRVND